MQKSKKIFEKVGTMGIAEVKKFSTSSLITRTTNDIGQIQMLISMGLQLMIKAPITAVWAVTKILGKRPYREDMFSNIDWGTWLEQVYQGRQFETTVIALTSSYAPYDVLERYQSTSDGNFINYSNSEVDKIMAQIPLTADINERTALYHQVLGILTDDACSVYLQDPTTITAVSTRLEGYHVYPMYVQDMSQVRLAGN